MKWWAYVLMFIALVVPNYLVYNRGKVRAFFTRIRVYFIVRSQEFYIKDFAFEKEDEVIYFDYLVINAAGVFAISMHSFEGKLSHYNGRIYLKAHIHGKIYHYFNPVPHDVRKVIKLNDFVPEDTDIIPVIILSQGNEKPLRAMWLTPIKNLSEVLAERGEKPLSDDAVKCVYNKLLAVKTKHSKAKKAEIAFMKRYCPRCGAFLYDKQQGEKIYLQCRNCDFRRDFTASIVPEHGEDY